MLSLMDISSQNQKNDTGCCLGSYKTALTFNYKFLWTTFISTYNYLM